MGGKRGGAEYSRAPGDYIGGAYAEKVKKNLQQQLDSLSTTPAATTGGDVIPGIPEPFGLPWNIQRVDDDGKIRVLMTWRFPAQCVRLRIGFRKVKKNGTRTPVEYFHTEIPFGATQYDFETPPLQPNRTFEVMIAIAKLVTAATDDGGTRAVNGSETGSPIATFTTGAGPSGGQVINHLLNSKFKFSDLDWDGTGLASELAKWFYRGTNSNRVNTTGGAGNNYWDKNAGTLSFKTNDPARQVTGKMYKRPFDAGEPAFIQFQAFYDGVVPAGGIAFIMQLVEGDGTDPGVRTISPQVLIPTIESKCANRWVTFRVQTSINTTYVPRTSALDEESTGSGSGGIWQGIRFECQDPVPSAGRLQLDKVMVSHVDGAYSPCPVDHSRPVRTPTGRTSGQTVARGIEGYGISANAPAAGGFVIVVGNSQD